MSLTAWLLLTAVAVAVVLLWQRGPERTTPQQLPDDEGTDGTDDVGLIEIEDAIDLHGFQPREIPAVVESYLEAAVAKGYQEVRLIHGKGKGVQRKRVRQLLARHPMVASFTDAPGHRGGWGATLARLKLKRPK